MKSIFSILLLTTFHFGFAQSDSTTNNKKYFVWIAPSEATHVYGLLFTFFPKEQGIQPKVNGAEINICPIAIFFAPVMLIHSVLDSETLQPPKEKIEDLNFDNFKKINGLEIGFGNLDKTIINGIDINLSGSFDSKVNGITFSGVLNKHYIINGLTFAVMGNHDVKCRGVQIGLIYSCQNLRGFQFGLWNKNQRRKLPLINFAFK